MALPSQKPQKPPSPSRAKSSQIIISNASSMHVPLSRCEIPPGRSRLDWRNFSIHRLGQLQDSYHQNLQIVKNRLLTLYQVHDRHGKHRRTKRKSNNQIKHRLKQMPVLQDSHRDNSASLQLQTQTNQAFPQVFNNDFFKIPPKIAMFGTHCT